MRYVADDGTEFETEKECREYEQEINTLLGYFTLYDGQYRKISTTTDEFANSYFSNVEYLSILSHADAVKEYFRTQYGIDTGINGDGIYWLNDDGVWINLKTEIQRCQDKINRMESVIEKITNILGQ